MAGEVQLQIFGLGSSFFTGRTRVLYLYLLATGVHL